MPGDCLLMGLMTETLPVPSDSQTERAANLERPVYTARLARKYCLSEPAQCFHLEFTADELPGI